MHQLTRHGHKLIPRIVFFSFCFPSKLTVFLPTLLMLRALWAISVWPNIMHTHTARQPYTHLRSIYFVEVPGGARHLVVHADVLKSPEFTPGIPHRNTHQISDLSTRRATTHFTHSEVTLERSIWFGFLGSYSRAEGIVIAVLS